MACAAAPGTVKWPSFRCVPRDASHSSRSEGSTTVSLPGRSVFDIKYQILYETGTLRAGMIIEFLPKVTVDRHNLNKQHEEGTCTYKK